ncbi:oxidoreductase [Streptomyces carminius]|uniref:Oxidoreductase n=1 Tax=Streptomyces carminius TaxID=2665496 RepID=A0A2M8MBI2_9ACTN|nr:aldo/keto reductase [Streptomyces carminius]PJF01561.1 oxidoreductase [Streptomyces carminius]
MTDGQKRIERSGTVRIGDRTVHRMSFGAMRLADKEIWGPPADRENSIRVARRAVDLGIDHIDTADSYAFGVTEEILREALHPYPDDLLIATKAGQTQVRPGEWAPVGRPSYLRQQCEASLRRLRVERIGLFYLHRVDPQVPFDDQLGAMKELQEEGKIAHFGLSSVTVEQIEQARRVIDVAAVQNIFNVAARMGEDVLDHCEQERIPFVAWFPILSGGLAAPEGVVAEVAAELDSTPAQVALAWLLARSDVLCPIPGTSSIAHLEENVAASSLRLSDDHLARLAALRLPEDQLAQLAAVGSARE